MVSSLATMSSSEAEPTIPSDANSHTEFGVQELNDLVLNANARHKHKRRAIQRIENDVSLIDSMSSSDSDSMIESKGASANSAVGR